VFRSEINTVLHVLNAYVLPATIVIAVVVIGGAARADRRERRERRRSRDAT
jgi:hypothetical protein